MIGYAVFTLIFYAIVALGQDGPLNCQAPQLVTGATLFPWLIIPVQWQNPNTAYGTQYNVNVRPGQDVVVQFTVPNQRPDGTCSLQLGLPIGPSYTLSGSTRRFRVARLNGQVSTSTTYASLGNLDNLAYTTFVANPYQERLQILLRSQNCPAGAVLTFIIRSLDDSVLDVYENKACPATGVFIVWNNAWTSG